MNFSNSGIGFSFGVRGCRVSTGPRGTFVNLGVGGVYYRQKIASRDSRRRSQLDTGEAAAFTGQPLFTASADELIDSTSARTLETLNACVTRPAIAWLIALTGAAISLAGIAIHPALSLVMALVAGYGAYVAHLCDTERRTHSLEFRLDEATGRRWSAMNAALASLARSQRIWRITSSDATYDWKRNAGATSLLGRTSASLYQCSAKYIASNVTPFCLNIGTQCIYFFPDMLYVYQNGRYGAVDYSLLNTECGQTQFIENEYVPADTQVVGYTWQYVNKNGGPDRRFNNNRQLPIAKYGVLRLWSSTGMNVLLHFSSSDAPHNFACEFKNSLPNVSNRAHQASERRQSQSSNARANQNQTKQKTSQPPPFESPRPACYVILDLSPSCTKEEAERKYREIVKTCHPDRVSHMAEEFQHLAHEKMKKINQAYSELKRVRGW